MDGGRALAGLTGASVIRWPPSAFAAPAVAALSLLIAGVQRASDPVVEVDTGVGVADALVAIAGDGIESCSSLWRKFGSRFTKWGGNGGICGRAGGSSRTGTDGEGQPASASKILSTSGRCSSAFNFSLLLSFRPDGRNRIAGIALELAVPRLQLAVPRRGSGGRCCTVGPQPLELGFISIALRPPGEGTTGQGAGQRNEKGRHQTALPRGKDLKHLCHSGARCPAVGA